MLSHVSTLWAADNALFIIPFGAEPGASLTHAYDYGVPPVKEGVYTMRVPSVDSVIMPIFADVELSIEAPQKTVRRSHAERAYRELSECTKASLVIQEKLKSALPSAYTGADAAYQFQSADGHVIGGTYCKVERYLPNPVLIFDLTVVP
jgi:hypothetical protein